MSISKLSLLLPGFPDNFILPEEKSLLREELDKLSMLNTNTKRIKEIIRLLDLPVVYPDNQAEEILPGNGFKLRFIDGIDSKAITGILVGTEIKQHRLPNGIVIVPAINDKAGAVIARKKVEEKFKLIGRKCKVEKIKIPSEMDWIFEQLYRLNQKSYRLN